MAYTLQERALLAHLRKLGPTGEFSLDDAIEWLGLKSTDPTDYREAGKNLIRQLHAKQASDTFQETTGKGDGPWYRYNLAS